MLAYCRNACFRDQCLKARQVLGYIENKNLTSRGTYTSCTVRLEQTLLSSQGISLQTYFTVLYLVKEGLCSVKMVK
jgi:hypothetical protein